MLIFRKWCDTESGQCKSLVCAGNKAVHSDEVVEPGGPLVSITSSSIKLTVTYSSQPSVQPC